MMHLTQLSNKSPTEYAEVLLNKFQRCNRGHDEYVLNASFIEAVPESIPQCMRSYWGSKKTATIHYMSLRASSLKNPQRVIAQGGQDA